MTRSHDSIRVFHVIPSLVCFIASVSACANGIKHLKGIDAAPRLQAMQDHGSKPEKKDSTAAPLSWHCKHLQTCSCDHAMICCHRDLAPLELPLMLFGIEYSIFEFDRLASWSYSRICSLLAFQKFRIPQKKMIQQHVFSGAVLINLLGRLPRSLLLLFAWLALLGFLLLLLLWRFFVVNFAAVHHGTRSNWNKWVVGAAKNRQNLEPKHGIRGSMQHQLAVAKALGGRAFCLEKQKHNYPQSPATLRPWCRPGPVCMTSRPTPRALRKCWDGRWDATSMLPLWLSDPCHCP